MCCCHQHSTCSQTERKLTDSRIAQTTTRPAKSMCFVRVKMRLRDSVSSLLLSPIRPSTERMFSTHTHAQTLYIHTYTRREIVRHACARAKSGFRYCQPEWRSPASSHRVYDLTVFGDAMCRCPREPYSLSLSPLCSYSLGTLNLGNMVCCICFVWTRPELVFFFGCLWHIYIGK